MNVYLRTFALILLYSVLPRYGRADVTVPDLFADHMVFQRGVPIRIWGKAAPGEKVKVTFEKACIESTAATSGDWDVSLPAHAAGGPYKVQIAGKNSISLVDVLVGDVWLASGQSNMDMRLYPQEPWTHGVLNYRDEIAHANYPHIRFFSVIMEAASKPKETVHGVWEECVPDKAANFAAVAYYFSRKINTETGVPIGMLVSAVGATGINCWMDVDVAGKLESNSRALEIRDQKLAAAAPAIESYEKEQLPAYYSQWKKKRSIPGRMTARPDLYKGFIFSVGGCYNAMIAPLTRFPLTGFIWYQGESNAQYPTPYAENQKTLITSWRKAWRHPSAPFYFVQLAANDPVERFNMEPSKATALSDNYGYMRLAQEATLDLPDTGMAVATDQGDRKMVHYGAKKPVGERLALIALNRVYKKKVEYQGPVLQKWSLTEKEIVLYFKTRDGRLVSKSGDNLSGFELAGSDKVFYPATAQIEANTVRVTNPGVNSPVSIRYGWGCFPTLSLYNSADLPAPPFLRQINSASESH
jgi:sialate O-acetylesterase